MKFVRTPHLSLVTTFALALCCAKSGLGQGTESHLPTLTHVIQAHTLTEEQANQKYPLHFLVVVTYATDGDMFVQDSTGGIWVNRPHGLPLPSVGNLLDLEGVTSQTDFAPDIAQPRWRVVGEAPMPQPERPTYDQMASTSEDIEVTLFSIFEISNKRTFFNCDNFSLSTIIWSNDRASSSS